MQDNMDTTTLQSPDTGSNNLPKPEPTQAGERIEVLDVIRGFALLGILIANMAMYNSPAMYYEVLGQSMWTGLWDTIASGFINLFVQGKFYSMFSFLFGLGFTIFYERAIAKTAKPMRLFYRRLFILLLIGLVHAFFIWYGDILVTYALLGFLLPLFFYRKPKTLLIWAVSLFAAFILFTALAMSLMTFAKTVAGDTFTEMMQPFIADMERTIESSLHAYGEGTFAEIMAQRASDASFGISQVFSSIFIIFPLFLLGLYAGKRAIFQHMEANLGFIKKVWIWGLVIGLAMSIVKFLFKNMMGGDIYSFNMVFHLGAGFFGDTGLCLFYITSIILLYRNINRRRVLKPLSYMGRMALTNYLLQSIVCTTIFYNYGLGLYGKVGFALGLLLSIVIYIIQLFISKYWFRHFQFGPVEWLWRSLTYGKRFGMKMPESQELP